MKTNYVGISDGAKSMAYLDQERGVSIDHQLLRQRISVMKTNTFYVFRELVF